MRISQLIEGLNIRVVAGDADRVISTITEDSRQATEACLFVARTGRTHAGRGFVDEAVQAGAVAVLHDGGGGLGRDGIIELVSDSLVDHLPGLAERFYGHPSRQLQVVGVTGTNGKTTVATLIRDMMNRSGIRCGLIGTVELDDGLDRVESALTTPPAIELSAYLSRMVANRCSAVVMETSSHALAQFRTAGLEFDIGVFTNLSGDHLDYHMDMDDYAAAKALLFEQLPAGGVAIVNADDPASGRMIRDCSARQVQVSTTRPEVGFHAQVIEMTAASTLVRMRLRDETSEVRLPLTGTHNVMNALQAAAVGVSLGLTPTQVCNALTVATAPPGRLEPVVVDAVPGPTVLVDYAHTDGALQNVLRAVRPTVPATGQLWVVFGCGGDRDRSKRPRMAEVAATLADRVILTSDNPRTESPQGIIDQMQAGLPSNFRQARQVPDRRRAICCAVLDARDQDVVLIAGKGHENYQLIGSVKIPFDDRIIAREALSRRAQREAMV